MEVCSARSECFEISTEFVCAAANAAALNAAARTRMLESVCVCAGFYFMVSRLYYYRRTFLVEHHFSFLMGTVWQSDCHVFQFSVVVFE